MKFEQPKAKTDGMRKVRPAVGLALCLALPGCAAKKQPTPATPKFRTMSEAIEKIYTQKLPPAAKTS
jgi:hypothetical protein